MTMQNAMAALAVKDLVAATDWYSRLFNRAPTEKPMKGLVEWQFPEGGWLQLYEKADKAGKGSVTIVENDLKARISELKAHKFTIASEASSDKTTIAIVEDDDGNQIVFAEQLH